MKKLQVYITDDVGIKQITLNNCVGERQKSLRRVRGRPIKHYRSHGADGFIDVFFSPAVTARQAAMLLAAGATEPLRVGGKIWGVVYCANGPFWPDVREFGDYYSQWAEQVRELDLDTYVLHSLEDPEECPNQDECFLLIDSGEYTTVFHDVFLPLQLRAVGDTVHIILGEEDIPFLYHKVVAKDERNAQQLLNDLAARRVHAVRVCDEIVRVELDERLIESGQ